MIDGAGSCESPPPRAQGRVLKAVAKTWPGFIAGAVEGRAREFIDEDRYDEAAAVLEQGLERYGAESVSRLLFAWCLHLAGRQEAALEWAGQAVEAEPENADAHWLRSNILFELERPDDAVAALWRAVELTPDNGRYYMQLAWIQYQDLEFAKTRELVEQALERAPDDAWVQHTAGRIYDHHLRHRRAHAHYVRALELEPDDVDVRADLAEILQTRGRLSSGVRVAWETVSAAGDGGEPYVAEHYESTLRRWSWRWYEWALRAALVLNVADWIIPTPVMVGAALMGVLVVAYGVAWARSLLVLPRQCRRDLVGKGRRGHFVGALVRTSIVVGGMALVLPGELSALQHLGVLALIVAGYVEWSWRAARIAGNRMFGGEAVAAEAGLPGGRH
jgi:tetratricopeptide (TPR) repeat protein